MREILFRGKAINRDNGYHRTEYKNGDWVYGLLTRPYDERFENLPAEMTDTSGISGIEVDYKSVEQYTGLTDKNGKKIFEGDIVRYDGEKHIVVFETRGETGYFGIKIDRLETWNFCLSVPAKSMEVIGNIYDNPELIGGEANG